MEKEEEKEEEKDFLFVYQMDIERILFILTKYLRTRLLKIQLQAEAIDSSSVYRSFLSSFETEFLEKFIILNKNYFRDNFYSKLETKESMEKVLNSNDIFLNASPNLQV